MKTLSEKIRDKADQGHKVKCDYCGKRKSFNDNWRMTWDRMVACPDCVDNLSLKNKVLVGI